MPATMTRPASRRIAQSKDTGVLGIRDDGVLVSGKPRILALPNVRPYYGDPNATLEERLRYLAGLSNNGRRAVIGIDDAPFDMRTATKDEILKFMDEERGVVMNGASDLETLRKEAGQIIKKQESEYAQRDEQAMQAVLERSQTQMSTEARAAAERDAMLEAQYSASDKAERAKAEREELAAVRAARASKPAVKAGIA